MRTDRRSGRILEIFEVGIGARAVGEEPSTDRRAGFRVRDQPVRSLLGVASAHAVRNRDWPDMLELLRDNLQNIICRRVDPYLTQRVRIAFPTRIQLKV